MLGSGGTISCDTPLQIIVVRGEAMIDFLEFYAYAKKQHGSNWALALLITLLELAASLMDY
jgi:hypothetical protein